jgi:hypothetical protein
MPMMPQMTRHPFMENPNMPKPTQNPATPKQAAGGKKNDPHLSTAADQSKEGEGRGSQSDQRPEHQESISHQEKAHNPNIDRGETEKPVADQDAGQESRNPPGRNSRGVSEDEDDSASGAYFNRASWMSQVFSDTETIDSSSKLVLLALGHLFNERGECWPTQAYLAEITKLGLRTVIRKLEDLEAAGWISTDRNLKIDGKRRAILYKALR